MFTVSRRVRLEAVQDLHQAVGQHRGHRVPAVALVQQVLQQVHLRQSQSLGPLPRSSLDLRQSKTHLCHARSLGL